MDNLHLVTGYLGYDHISAEDQGAFNAALIGDGQFVLKKGYVFRADIMNSATIRVHDGELMMGGRFVRMEPDTWVDLEIRSGTVGVKRNDLIAVRYTKDTNTGVESTNLVVIEGAAVASNPVDPAYADALREDDNLANGRATLHEYPLWRIPIDGTTVGTPVCLFGEPYEDSMQTLPEIRHQMANLTSEIYSVAARVEAGYYVGDGNNNKTITTSVENPFLFVVVGSDGYYNATGAGQITAVKGATKYRVKDSGGNKHWVTVTMGNSRVLLENASIYFNNSGETYHYVIVGN